MGDREAAGRPVGRGGRRGGSIPREAWEERGPEARRGGGFRNAPNSGPVIFQQSWAAGVPLRCAPPTGPAQPITIRPWTSPESSLARNDATCSIVARSSDDYHAVVGSLLCSPPSGGSDARVFLASYLP
ncbi:hypothetical protein JX265_008300 [Neoarthrinium moseri]|uniref:Uncharacterized protein n=1 Tax=Neoarthrinium moseri TaxID=1658444 RepID=A0A9P9WIJ7_9PEZI|nr:hypothetical protein JX266_002747 [Neoarthrinium moseri]KAI1865253.1 hypothetical protein JX265_008300 [Neoarthrinium moseri]